MKISMKTPRIGFVIGLALAASVAAIVWGIDSKFDTGWAQVIGAVLAILGSVAIALRQEKLLAMQARDAERKAALLRAEDALDLSLGAAALGEEIKLCMTEVIRVLERRDARHGPMDGEELAQLIESIHIYAGKAIPAASLQPLLEMQRKCSAVLSEIRGIQPNDVSQKRLGKVRAYEGDIHRAIKSLGVAVKKAERTRDQYLESQRQAE